MNNKYVVEALFKDLRMEYGLALRYLTVLNGIDQGLCRKVAPILHDLATDCVSHSTIVKGMLVEMGEKPENYFDSFTPEFDMLDKALHSSFLLERKMAVDYDALSKTGPKEYRERFSALSKWEVGHMNQVQKAMDVVKHHSLATTKAVNSIDAKMEEAANSVDDIHSIGGIIIVSRKNEEKRIAEARMNLAISLEREETAEELKKVTEEAVSHIGYDSIGMPASKVLDADSIGVLWGGEPYSGYCVQCNRDKEIKNPKRIVLANGLPAVKGKCDSCDSPLFSIV